MSYSYKPVLLKAVLLFADDKGRVKLSDIVTYFREFYEARRAAGLVVEKANSIYAKGGYTDAQAQRNILSNPFKRFEDMQMLHHTKTLGVIQVDESVWKKLTREEKQEIERICDEKLEQYYFGKVETDHMDVIRDSIENRADDVCKAQAELRETAVYPHSASYAKEHGELELYRASNNANLQCKEAIEATVREHFDGMYLSHDAAKGVIQTYGLDRVMLVLANTVQLQDWDGRYSRRNKEWAKTIPNFNSDTVRHGYAVNSHPAVLDGFIDLVREEQCNRGQVEKTQQPRTSVREKLKQEPPAHKPAAPKKREPER